MGKPGDAGAVIARDAVAAPGSATLELSSIGECRPRNTSVDRTVRSFFVDLAQIEGVSQEKSNRTVRSVGRRSEGRIQVMELEALASRKSAADSDGGAKRRQIMEGARSVFLSSGFDGASMNDMARAAGVSKGTLYAYFNSKDELFEAIIRAEYAQSAERLCTLQARGRRPGRCLPTSASALSAGWPSRARSRLPRVVIAAAEKFPNVGRAFYEAGPLYGATRLAVRAARASRRRGAQGPRSRARRLALRRSLPELRLQAPPVRRRRLRSAARTSKPRSRRGSMCFMKAYGASRRAE